MVKINYVGKTLLIEKDEKKVLVIGDLHLGYLEKLRNSGVLILGNSFDDVLNELDLIFEKVENIDKIILLGDIKHEFGKISNEEWKEIGKLLKYLKNKTENLIVIKGNHDKNMKVIVENAGLKMINYYLDGNFAFMHGDKDFPEVWDKKIKFWVMGHGHPAVRINDGVKEEKYKCFLRGKFNKKEIIIVPSFFGINEGSDPRDYDLGFAWKFDLLKFGVFVVKNELEVLDFGILNKLNLIK